MIRWIALVILALAAQAQTGRFAHGYRATDHGISISIVTVHDGPACRAADNCSWMVIWTSTKASETAEIAVTLAGMDSPVVAAVVPGRKDARLDQHNPVFDVKLASVSQIDFLLWNGTKQVGGARFK